MLLTFKRTVLAIIILIPFSASCVTYTCQCRCTDGSSKTFNNVTSSEDFAHSCSLACPNGIAGTSCQTP